MRATWKSRCLPTSTARYAPRTSAEPWRGGGPANAPVAPFSLSLYACVWRPLYAAAQAISLFGRDCSVQRRHQKIIEEAPVTVCPPEKFVEMEAAAVRLAMLVGYVSVGTVEYLYMPETNTFSFLELNPRLQVRRTHVVEGRCCSGRGGG